jgi:hypothetical protein
MRGTYFCTYLFISLISTIISYKVSLTSYKKIIASCTICLGFTLASPNYDIAYAGSGDPAKQSFTFGEDSSDSRGAAIYDENLTRLEKTKAVEKRWKNMIKTITESVKSNKVSPAKSAIEINMNALKSDMRLVSKIISGGDILQRNGDLAKFDYNSGQFQLKEVASLVEEAIGIINDIYFYKL